MPGGEVRRKNVIATRLREVQLNHKTFTLMKHASYLNSLRNIKL
jgi:hypothetical protein